MNRADVRDHSQRMPGAHIQNEGKYTRACKACGALLMMARTMGPRRYGWWAFDEKPIDENGVRYYTVHQCPVVQPVQGSLIR